MIKKRNHPLLFTNRRLFASVDGHFIQDDFSHEHYLCINEGGYKVLFSGCAHNGILNIMENFIDKYGCEPDIAISGFHLMKKSVYTDDELSRIKDTAHALMKYHTRFITCHCTGEAAYGIMKNIMGDKLEYVHSGEEVKFKYKNASKTDPLW